MSRSPKGVGYLVCFLAFINNAAINNLTPVSLLIFLRIIHRGGNARSKARTFSLVLLILIMAFVYCPFTVNPEGGRG